MKRDPKANWSGGGPLFQKACELSETTPTRRQFKKFNRGFGKARTKMRAAVAEMQKVEMSTVE